MLTSTWPNGGVNIVIIVYSCITIYHFERRYTGESNCTSEFRENVVCLDPRSSVPFPTRDQSEVCQLECCRAGAVENILEVRRMYMVTVERTLLSTLLCTLCTLRPLYPAEGEIRECSSSPLLTVLLSNSINRIMNGVTVLMTSCGRSLCRK